MPTCCVPGCKNSSDYGFLLRCFPRNPQLCATWIKNVNRPNWVPNHNHRICEVHFAPRMWEKVRVDGKRKLRHNAVPTIFGDRIIEDDPAYNILTLPDTNGTGYSSDKLLENNVQLNNQAVIRILPSNIQQLAIPICTLQNQQTNGTQTIVIDKEGQIRNLHTTSSLSRSTSFVEPLIKTDTTQSTSTLSRNTSVLKNQLLSSNNKTPIIIPVNAGIFKPQVHLPNEMKDTNSILTSEPQVSLSATESSKTPIEMKSESNVTETISLSNDDDIKTDEESASESTGIILNKTEAKKMEKERFQKMDKLLLKQLKLNNELRKKLCLIKNKMQQMIKEQNSDYRKYLSNIFTEDQIRALEMKHINPKSIIAWSHATMLKALKLKELCGTKGYEELLKQNMPLPSIRTISRWCSTRNLPIP